MLACRSVTTYPIWRMSPKSLLIAIAPELHEDTGKDASVNGVITGVIRAAKNRPEAVCPVYRRRILLSGIVGCPALRPNALFPPAAAEKANREASVRSRAFAVARIFAVACLFCGAAAWADSFPSGKIRIVVPTAAAGVADSLARIVGAKVQDNIGQTVYVEDR